MFRWANKWQIYGFQKRTKFKKIQDQTKNHQNLLVSRPKNHFVRSEIFQSSEIRISRVLQSAFNFEIIFKRLKSVLTTTIIVRHQSTVRRHPNQNRSQEKQVR